MRMLSSKIENYGQLRASGRIDYYNWISNCNFCKGNLFIKYNITNKFLCINCNKNRINSSIIDRKIKEFTIEFMRNNIKYSLEHYIITSEFKYNSSYREEQLNKIFNNLYKSKHQRKKARNDIIWRLFDLKEIEKLFVEELYKKYDKDFIKRIMK